MKRSCGIQTIFGAHEEYATPFLTRAWLGRLRLHIFHRGDLDPDCHDHPWDFWTFPLTSYVEEFVTTGYGGVRFVRRRVVRAWRLHHRPAEHTHRVLGRFDPRGGHPAFQPGWDAFYPGDGTLDAGPAFKVGRIVTVVWQGTSRRPWGFLRRRDGRWCWTPWREYVFGGGKHAPCGDGE